MWSTARAQKKKHTLTHKRDKTAIVQQPQWVGILILYKSRQRSEDIIERFRKDIRRDLLIG